MEDFDPALIWLPPLLAGLTFASIKNHLKPAGMVATLALVINIKHFSEGAPVLEKTSSVTMFNNNIVE